MRPRKLIWVIIFLTLAALFIDLPKSVSIGGKQFHKPDFDIRILGFRIVRDFEPKLGLDLVGGTSITLQADMGSIPEDQQKNALESAKEVIARRINPNGTLEPVIQTTEGNNGKRIIIELPGITDINEVNRLVGTTGKLEFRQLKEATPSALITFENTVPTGLSGSDLKDAQASFDQTRGTAIVVFRVADDSQEKFAVATQKLVSKPMVIFLDEQFISAPTVQEAIRNSGQISGNFTIEQTKDLAKILNAGALPVPLKHLDQHSISATLGAESMKKSLFAGAIGIGIVILFMIAYYGVPGVLASVALVIYALLTFAIFKLIPVTLTLAGIAGFILSIGMAVDANILIFERMKEEMRWGKKRVFATEAGFARAWTSIRDSNISSLITSFILYQFGTGLVRGFALTLAIGILISMFSAIVITRTFLRLLYRD